MGAVRGWPLPHAVKPGWGWSLVVGLLLALIGAASYALLQQLTAGLGITGMNSPAYWGL